MQTANILPVAEADGAGDNAKPEVEEAAQPYSDMHKFLTEESWLDLLRSEFPKPLWWKIVRFLNEQSAAGKKIYPPKQDVFTAFNLCPVGAIRVVIIGQDPYHGPGQAHGLSFSVRPGVYPPPSLQNIFKELKADLGDEFTVPRSGDLTPWAQRGVFLLNTSLTVNGGEAASHSECGWRLFTEQVLRQLSKKHPHLVFVLWGRHAQNSARVVDSKRHMLFSSAHPSPLSAHNGFFGSRFASKVNQHLVSLGQAPINWKL
jgi:uracil-DNA glycosylase